MAIDLSPDKIGSASSFEVMRQNCFEIMIPSIGQTGLQMSVIGVPFPKFGVNVEEMPYKNSMVKLAGRSLLAQDFEIRCRDVVDAVVRDALWAWAIQVYDPATGKVGKQQTYKRQCELTMTGPDGGDEQKWKLKGCWPSAIDFGSGDMSNSGAVEISVTLSVDNIEKL